MYGEGCKNLYLCRLPCGRAGGRAGVCVAYMASSSFVGTYDMYVL